MSKSRVRSLTIDDCPNMTEIDTIIGIFMEIASGKGAVGSSIIGSPQHPVRRVPTVSIVRQR